MLSESYNMNSITHSYCNLWWEMCWCFTVTTHHSSSCLSFRFTAVSFTVVVAPHLSAGWNPKLCTQFVPLERRHIIGAWEEHNSVLYWPCAEKVVTSLYIFKPFYKSSEAGSIFYRPDVMFFSPPPKDRWTPLNSSVLPCSKHRNANFWLQCILSVLRWISYSSNRKWSLLKVQCANMLRDVWFMIPFVSFSHQIYKYKST